MPMELLYCENQDCRVELYHAGTVSSMRNCPGCGRMGRNKGKS